MTEIRHVDRATHAAGSSTPALDGSEAGVMIPAVGDRVPEDDFFSRGWMYFSLAAVTLLLAMLGTLIYNVIERDLTESAISVRTSVTALAANSVSQEFQGIVEIGRSLATRVRFGELASAGRWREAVAIMASVPNDFADVEQVLLFSADGVLQASIPEIPELVGHSFGSRDWYQSTLSSARPFVSATLHEESFPRGDFMVLIPMQTPDKGIYGVLALRIGAKRLAEYFSGIHPGSDGEILVIDRSGYIAYNSVQPRSATAVSVANDPVVARALAGQSDVEVDDLRLPRNGADAEPFVSAFAPVSFGWAVVAQWPRSTVFAARDHELRRVTISMVALIFTIAAAVLLSFQLVAQRKQRRIERAANIELEDHVRQRTAQLEMMNRELESFSYSISHDLRAPLRAIDGYANLLCDEHAALLNENSKRYAANIKRNISHMSQLIDELLELSRLGTAALSLEDIDMTLLANEVLDEIFPNRRTTVVEVGDLPPIRGDIAMIRQVWRNLLDNAIKYSSRQSTPHIVVSAQRSGEEVVYCVADNGVGFDMQHSDLLFKPFSRLHPAGEFGGTGVGLAIVKRIVERHRGSVRATSMRAGGTQIYFSLPARSRVTGDE